MTIYSARSFEVVTNRQFEKWKISLTIFNAPFKPKQYCILTSRTSTMNSLFSSLQNPRISVNISFPNIGLIYVSSSSVFIGLLLWGRDSFLQIDGRISAKFSRLFSALASNSARNYFRWSIEWMLQCLAGRTDTGRILEDPKENSFASCFLSLLTQIYFIFIVSFPVFASPLHTSPATPNIALLSVARCSMLLGLGLYYQKRENESNPKIVR